MRHSTLVLVCVTACGPIGANGSSSGDNGGGGAPEGGVTPHDAGAAVAESGVEGGGTPSDAKAPGGYSVTGNTIYDSNGKPHLFHGVDRPSLEWNASGDQLSADDYKSMAAWKANVVRIALSQDFWLQGAAKYNAGYAATVDQQVRWAEQAGLDVLLDLHWSDRGDLTNASPGQQRMADNNSISFWKAVADKYKGDGHVLFELYNEPHDVAWEVWLSGGASGDGFTAVGMQQLYDAVRGTGAENLVVIGGLAFAYDLSGVPAHRVQGHNIVYATHPYNQSSKQPANWDAGFGSLAATDPVMATEFGDTKTCAADYASQLIQYADAHKVSWSAWAWYVSGCQFPSIIADWSGTPNAVGQAVKAALQTY